MLAILGLVPILTEVSGKIFADLWHVCCALAAERNVSVLSGHCATREFGAITFFFNKPSSDCFYFTSIHKPVLGSCLTLSSTDKEQADGPLLLRAHYEPLLMRGAVQLVLTGTDWTSLACPAARKTNQANAWSRGASQGYPSVLLSWCQGLAPCLWLQQVNPLVLLCCSADGVHLEQLQACQCPIKEVAVWVLATSGSNSCIYDFFFFGVKCCIVFLTLSACLTGWCGWGDGIWRFLSVLNPKA